MMIVFLMYVLATLRCAEPQLLDTRRTDQMRGFTTQFSYYVGDTVNLTLSRTDQAVNMTVELYRIGYYGGQGRSLVTVLSANSTNDIGPAQLENLTTLDTQWTIPGSAQPGLYVATTKRSILEQVASPSSVYIPFIVRWPEHSTKGDLLFRVADLSWRVQDALSQRNRSQPHPSENESLVIVSYNSLWGLSAAATGGGEWYRNATFGAEAAVIYWLEKHGYDISYCSCADFEEFAERNLLPNYKVLMSVGGDEYWTPGLRFAYLKAHADGIHTAFLSENAGQRTVHWSQVGNNNMSSTSSPDRRSFVVNSTELESPVRIPSAFDLLTRTQSRASHHHAAINASERCVQQQLQFLARDYNCHRTGHHGSTTSSATAVATDTADSSHSSALTFTAGTTQWAWALGDLGPINGTTRREVQQATLDLLSSMGVLPGSFRNSSDELSPPLTYPSIPAQRAPPRSLIQHVKFEVTPRGNAVKIVGRAEAAQDGGNIASVDVSLDGGANWHVAEGSARWHFIHYFAPTVSIQMQSARPATTALKNPVNICHTETSYRIAQFDQGALYGGECKIHAPASNFRPSADRGAALSLLIMTRATDERGSLESADPMPALCAVHTPKFAEVLPSHNRSHAHSAHFETHSGTLYVDAVAPNAVLLKVVGADLCAALGAVDDLVPNRNVLIVVQVAAMLMLLCGALVKAKAWRWIAALQSAV